MRTRTSKFETCEQLLAAEMTAQRDDARAATVRAEADLAALREMKDSEIGLLKVTVRCRFHVVSHIAVSPYMVLNDCAALLARTGRSVER